MAKKFVLISLSVLLVGVLGYTLFSFGKNQGKKEVVCEAAQSCPLEINETADLATGVLKIDSTPQGVKIYLNQTDTRKTTPATLNDLDPGNYEIRLESKTTYTWWVEIGLEAGNEVEIKALLVEREPAGQNNSAVTNYGFTLAASDPAVGAALSLERIGNPDEDFTVKLEFDTPLAAQSVTTANFALFDLSTGDNILTQVTYTAGQKYVDLIVSPSSVLTVGGQYEVKIASALQAADGTLLGRDLFWQFGKNVSNSTTAVSSYKTTSSTDDTSSSSTETPTDNSTITDAQIDETAASSDMFSELLKKSRDSARKADLAEIRTACELYYDEYNQYPKQEPVDDVINVQSELVPTFIKTIPKNPLETDLNKSGYLYESDGKSFVLQAEMELEQADGNKIYSIFSSI